MNSQGPSYVLAAWCWVVLFPDPVDGLQLNIEAKPLLIRGCLLLLKFHTMILPSLQLLLTASLVPSPTPSFSSRTASDEKAWRGTGNEAN